MDVYSFKNIFSQAPNFTSTYKKTLCINQTVTQDNTLYVYFHTEQSEYWYRHKCQLLTFYSKYNYAWD